MPKKSKQRELQALKNLISETDLMLSTITLQRTEFSDTTQRSRQWLLDSPGGMNSCPF
jgi:hypothetical protein